MVIARAVDGMARNVLQGQWKWVHLLEVQVWNWQNSTSAGVLLAKASHRVQAGSAIGG